MPLHPFDSFSITAVDSGSFLISTIAVALIAGHTNGAKFLLQQGSRIVYDCISGALERAMSQLTRTFKSEELIKRADFQLQCSEYASKK